MTGQIVGIHGMAKHQAGPRQLLLTWTAALGDGLEAAIGAPPSSVPSLDLAYYGNVFLPEPAPGSTVTMGSGPDRSEFAGLDDAELAELVATTEETFGADELADAAHRTEMGVSAVPKPLQAVLRVLDRRFGMAGAVLHVGVLRQVRRYLVDRATGSRVDPRIVTTADGRWSPIRSVRWSDTGTCNRTRGTASSCS
jgi:hypothetical protein